MNITLIEDLPSIGKNIRGWPWDKASPPAPRSPSPSDNHEWPKISILTPSFNQGRYLEETIRSVLLQGYPNLEFIILDGASSDDSVDIIKRYSPWITYWVSEKDNGQSDAINRGFAKATGDIFAWLCSDDYLLPGALQTVARQFITDPSVDVVAGSCYCSFDDEPEKSSVRECRKEEWERVPYAAQIWQPSCFFRRELIKRNFLVRTDLHYCMDRELWCYFRSVGAQWKSISDTLSVYRFTGANKSMTGKRKIVCELDEIYRDYSHEWIPLSFWLHKVWLPLVLIHKRHRFTPVRIVSRLFSRSISLFLRIFYPRDRLRILQKEYYSYALW